MDVHQLLGIASGIVLLSSGVPYIWNILYATTRPNKVTWFGWFLLGSSSFLIQITNRPDASIFMVGADTMLVFTIFCLALSRGVTRFTRLDVTCLLLGLLGFILWLGLNQPILALLANIAADLCFAIPTVVKSFSNPESESERGWQIAAFGMFLGILSKTDFGYINSLFPVYIFVMNTFIYVLCTGLPQRLFGYKKVS